MENALWDVGPARQTGEMASFLEPLDKPFPMVATADIGRVAAEALTQSWSGTRVIEIEGPKRYSQNEIAVLLANALSRSVVAKPVARGEWETRFQAQGTWPAPRTDMLDGFNSGWIAFEDGKNEHVIGTVPYETVMAELVKLVP